MKNNALFLVTMIALLIVGLGALYYQYRAGEFEDGRLEMTASPAPTQQVMPTETPQEGTASAQTQDEELETMPTVSEETDLDTIEQELEETQILEEDFSDL